MYKRIFVIGQDMPIEVANALEDYQVVVHGIDVNGNGVYDTGEDLLPAACGTLSQLSARSCRIDDPGTHRDATPRPSPRHRRAASASPGAVRGPASRPWIVGVSASSPAGTKRWFVTTTGRYVMYIGIGTVLAIVVIVLLIVLVF